MLGETADWNVNEYVLSNIADLLSTLVWFGSADGQKNKNRPKPHYRPGQVAPKDPDTKTFGSGSYSFDELDAIFAQAQGGDDVSVSKSELRTSTSSRARGESKPASSGNLPPSKV